MTTTQTHTCCECEHHIDETEAKDLRYMLNVLNCKDTDGYGHDFRREAGETRIERIGYALERVRPHDHRDPRTLTDCSGCDVNATWRDLEDIDGRLQEIARSIPVCGQNALCAKCQAEVKT